MIGVQALIAFVWRVPFGLAYSSFIIPPMLTTLVYAFVWADSDDAPESAASIWERILERVWAVIVIDLVITILLNTGLTGILAQDPIDIVLGSVIMLISAPLLFADTIATVEEMPVWWLLPGAFWRSLRVARGPIYVRAVAILALNLIPALVQVQLLDWMHAKGIANPDFWSLVPLNALTLPPIAAITAVVYRDATRKTPSAEAENAEIGD
jgi:hypothetical protein